MRRDHARRLAPGLLLTIAAIVGPAFAADEPNATMTVTGRVLDPNGKPVPHAAVTVRAMRTYPEHPALDSRLTAMDFREKRCDEMGRFLVEMPRTSSARHSGIIITALATGYGLGWTELDPDADPPEADVTLGPERILRGRLFDPQGQPASGVALRVALLDRGGMIRGPRRYIPRSDLLDPRWTDSPAWPGPAISDDEGRFTLRGLSPGMFGQLAVDDPRFGHTYFVFQTDGVADPGPVGGRLRLIQVDPSPEAKPVSLALKPARVINGQVIDADTSQPVPHALITGTARRYRADAEGRFRAPIELPGSDIFYFRVQAPDLVPYLERPERGRWLAGAVEHSVVVKLPRGVVVRGKVVEEGTDRPAPGAIVRFVPQGGAGRPADIGLPVATGPDGTYEVAGPPGPGYVVVQGPSDDYVLREFGGEGGPMSARPGRDRFYAHAYHAVELKPGEPTPTVDLAVRPARSVPLDVIDPDGRRVPEALIVSRLILPPLRPGAWRSWITNFSRGHVRNGRFVLHGLEPDVEVPVFILDPKRKQGAVARISGRSAKGNAATVRLQQCGEARMRLVDPEGKPLPRFDCETLLMMIVVPGPPYQGGAANRKGPLFAIEAFPRYLDTVNYPSSPHTDAEGRVTFPALIPGAPYRIVDRTAAINGGAPAIRKEFTVKPGETVELGDILIEHGRR